MPTQWNATYEPSRHDEMPYFAPFLAFLRSFLGLRHASSLAFLHELVITCEACGFNTVRVHAVASRTSPKRVDSESSALEVMDATFYMLCDQLGLLVWQDMPSGDMRAMPVWSDGRAMAEERHGADGDLEEITRSEASKRSFQDELKAGSGSSFTLLRQAMMRYLDPFVSVAVWVLFNEGWGQADTQERVETRSKSVGHLLD